MTNIDKEIDYRITQTAKHIGIISEGSLRTLVKENQNQLIETIEEELIKMPTGMFDSTPYKEKVLRFLENLAK